MYNLYLLWHIYSHERNNNNLFLKCLFSKVCLSGCQNNVFSSIKTFVYFQVN